MLKHWQSIPEKYVEEIAMYEHCDRDGHDRVIHVVEDQAMEWTQENLIEVNIDKTKKMVICFQRKELDVAQIIMQSSQIERVAAFKLLGIIFNNWLTWNKHVDYICQKPQQDYVF